MARLSIIALALALISSVAATQTAYINFVVNGANALNDTTTVQGDSGFIEIEEYNFAIQSPTSSSTTGAGAGKASASPLTFRSKVDRNSAKFFKYQASGESFDKVVLKVLDSNSTLAARYTFSAVIIVDQTINGTSGADSATQKVSLTYEKIELAIATVDSDGSASPVESTGWDLGSGGVTKF